MSNLNFSPTQLNKFIQLAENNPHWRWVVSGSLDAVGSKGEHIREGLDFELFRSNLMSLAKCENIEIEILPTVSSLSLPETPDLLLWILDFIKIYPSTKPPIWIGRNLVTWPAELHVGTLPIKFRATIDRCRSIVTGTALESLWGYLDQIDSLIASRRQPNQIKKVQSFFENMGKVQKKDYFSLFPVLGDILAPDTEKAAAQRDDGLVVQA